MPELWPFNWPNGYIFVRPEPFLSNHGWNFMKLIRNMYHHVWFFHRDRPSNTELLPFNGLKILKCVHTAPVWRGYQFIEFSCFYYNVIWLTEEQKQQEEEKKKPLKASDIYSDDDDDDDDDGEDKSDKRKEEGEREKDDSDSDSSRSSSSRSSRSSYRSDSSDEEWVLVAFPALYSPV